MPPELNYVRNMICGAKNGHAEDVAVLRNILRCVPNHAPDAAIIEMSELFLKLGLAEDERLKKETD